MPLHRLVFLSLILTGLTASLLPADDHSVVAPYVTDNVVAVAFADLASLDPARYLEALEAVGLVTVKAPSETNVTDPLQTFRRGLLQIGAEHVYVLFQADDLQQGAPCWVMTFGEGGNPTAARHMLTAASTIEPSLQVFREHNQVVLGGANETQLDALLAGVRDQPRPELHAAMASLDTMEIGLTILGDADSRRVVRETFPTLPAPFDAIDGTLIANDLHWVTLGLTLSSAGRFKLSIQTTRPDVATELSEALTHACDMSVPAINAWVHGGKEDSSSQLTNLSFLVPQVEDSRLTLTIDGSSEQTRPIKDVLRSVVEARRAPIEQLQKMDQFKQLALGVLLYEAEHGTIIEIANYNDEGSPLLSWRVHLLPYLGQKQLYDRFHLDEPWDSEHNRSLIAEMPSVFSDPNAEVRQRIGEGRTSYVAPRGAATLFPPRDALEDGQPLELRDITDGISRTMLFVETTPEHAVVWTQPKDWDVELDSPKRGVIDETRQRFTAAFADGHVRLIEHDAPAEDLQAWLTRSGNEK